MAGVINRLMPLEEKLEDKLIAQLINCLTHTHVHDSELSFRELKVDDGHVLLLNATNMMSKEKYSLLYRAIKDLIEQPSALTKQPERKLPQSRSERPSVRKSTKSQYDYAEEILEDEYDSDRPARHRFNRANKSNFY
jgi:hypothetical protein